jgi:CheY-like chemotaxis protein
VQSDRPTVLVIHDDGDALDLMTRLFEAGGFEVITAVTGFRAQTHLEGDRSIDVVVAPWDATHPVGGDVYRWALQKRYDLRDLFLFLASDVPAEFDRLVAGRCLHVSMERPNEVVRVAAAMVKRHTQLELARDLGSLDIDAGKPTLLLAEDDPALLVVIADLLGEAGYAVTRADTGNAAISQLEHHDFDAIVADWHMDAGSGADIYRWMREFKPWLADRIVFLASADGDDTSAVAPGRPMLRKGQDSGQLLSTLRAIVRER